MNKTVQSIIKKEAPLFDKAIQYLPNPKREIAYCLFFFWKSLMPSSLWKYSQEQVEEIINKWKEIIFFNEMPERKVWNRFEIWKLVKQYFDDVSMELLLQVLNSIQACQNKFRIPEFHDLEFFLDKIGGNIALCNLQILYRDELANDFIPSSEGIRYLGSNLLLWEMLKSNQWLLQRGRLFIPTEDLYSFNCREEDFVAGLSNNEIKDLTHFQLGKTKDLFLSSKRLIEGYPLEIFDCLGFICDSAIEEIDYVSQSEWDFSWEHPPEINIAKKNKFLKNLTKLKLNNFSYKNFFKIKP